MEAGHLETAPVGLFPEQRRLAQLQTPQPQTQVHALRGPGFPHFALVGPQRTIHAVTERAESLALLPDHSRRRRLHWPHWRPRIGVKQKLVAVMLAISVVATCAMGIASHYGFQRGFLNYLTTRGIDRLDAAAPRLADIYRRYHSWDYLGEHPSEWFKLVGLPAGMQAGPATRVFRGPFPMPPNLDVTGTGLRMALLDANRNFVIGVPKTTSGTLFRPIRVDGHTVGWLTLVPIQQLTDIADIRFQSRQLLLTWAIGLCAVAIAAIVALLLANAMLAPLRMIAAGTQRLAAGDFATRLPARRGDEIAQLAGDFNQLALTLESNERMRRDLMADLSHELRTPLAVLRAELEALEDGVRTASHESFRSLLAEVRLLSKLIQDVYDLSMADVGALTYRMEPMDMLGVLRSCVDASGERFARCGLRLATRLPPDPLMVRADETRLSQLFNNLLENSLRYTHAGGVVHVDCTRVDDTAQLVVEDSAPGVPQQLLPRLFERFFRVDNSRGRQTGGAGIGLALCSKIAEAHGARLEATASALGGLRIRMSIPLIAP